MPNVTLDLQEKLNRDVVRGVFEGACDIGIVAGVDVAPDLQIIPFSQDRLVIATPAGHALSQQREATFSEILDYAHIGLHDGSTLSSFIREKTSELNRDFNFRTQVYGFESICRLIEAGVGIGIVPESAARNYQKTMALDIVMLDEPWAIRERSVIVREYEALPACGRSLIERLISLHQAPDAPK